MLGDDGRGEVAGDLQRFFELFFEVFDREQCFRIDGEFCFGHGDLPFGICVFRQSEGADSAPPLKWILDSRWYFCACFAPQPSDLFPVYH